MRFYTVSVTARDGAAPAGYKYDGVACYVFSHPTGGHFYTTSATERDNAGVPAGSYQLEGTACYVYDTQIPGTVPFYRLVNASEHFFTTSATERDNAIAQYGYQLEGTACYVYDTQIPGTVPFYRLVNASEHFFTTSATERDDAIAQYGYQSEGTACYVYDTQIPGTVPFYRLVSSPDKVAMPFYQVYNAQNGDYFYTTSAAERDNAIAPGSYQLGGTACYVYSVQIPGTVPFYRLASTSEHFYTASAAERDNAIGQYGYHLEGTACYVFSAPTLERVPLYRLSMADNLGELEKVILSNIHFDLDHAVIETPHVEGVSTQDLVNGTDIEQGETFTFELDYSETRSWSTTFGIKGGIETTIKSGLPFIVDGGIKISAEVSSSTTWGTEETVARKYSAEIPVKVPPHTHVICKASASTSKVTIPYSADAVYHFSGGQDIPGNFTGIYEGATASLLQASWSTPTAV